MKLPRVTRRVDHIVQLSCIYPFCKPLRAGFCGSDSPFVVDGKVEPANITHQLDWNRWLLDQAEDLTKPRPDRGCFDLMNIARSYRL